MDRCVPLMCDYNEMCINESLKSSSCSHFICLKIFSCTSQEWCVCACVSVCARVCLCVRTGIFLFNLAVKRTKVNPIY